MPLNSLKESVQTLSALLQQARKLRDADYPMPGAIERTELMIEDTVDNLRALVDALLDAHRRGDLDAMVKKDAEDLHGGDVAKKLRHLGEDENSIH